MPSLWRLMDKLVHRERVIDRDNNHYMEKITDYETGDVIHEQTQPLSDHTGHGSEKFKKAPP